ncbi:MAG TPA: AbrB/MazE/SpoVT family DNA-binding domain-containing protein [Syntrophomonadaceae bacterium]|nr:AbrB/MazE/SpoVT family DNA-binding domain-containing protein [Syntrophomonadaceae bacterium]
MLGKITSKRQLTIPKDFYDKLNVSDDVENP